MGSHTSRNHLTLLFFEPINTIHAHEIKKPHRLGMGFQKSAEASRRYSFSGQDKLLKEMWRKGDGASRLDTLEQLVATLVILAGLLRHFEFFHIWIMDGFTGTSKE